VAGEQAPPNFALQPTVARDSPRRQCGTMRGRATAAERWSVGRHANGFLAIITLGHFGRPSRVAADEMNMTVLQSIVLALLVPVVVLVVIYALLKTSGVLLRRPRIFGVVLMVFGVLNPAITLWERDRSGIGLALSVVVGVVMFMLGFFWARRGVSTLVD
jgi:hypothetical protein